MRKAVLLHGWEGKGSNHWFPWLQEQLENRGFEVYSPNLPNTKTPNLQEQIDAVSHFVETMSKGDIVIGHSLGGTLAMNLIQQYSLQGIKAILVGPTYQGYNSDNKENYSEESHRLLCEYTSETINTKEMGNQYIICLSQNDKSIDLEKAEEYYCMFEDVEFLEFPNSGHFTKWDGVIELPEILEYLD